MSDIKWPTGEWSHTELADFNGKTKPSVYNQLQDALKNGKVVKTIKRQGKGKPTQLYKVNDGSVTIPTPTVEEIVVVKVKEKMKELNLPSLMPVVSLTVTPSSEEPEMEVEPEPTKMEPIQELVAEATELKEVCPCCKKSLRAFPDSTGILVSCVQPKTVCWSSEAPFGHGRNVKDAVKILNERWDFCSKDRKV